MIQAVAHCAQSVPQAFALLLPNRFLPAFISEQGLFELFQNAVRDVDVLEDLAKPGSDLFFPKVRELAPSPESGAVIVRVAALLDFRRYRAIVIGATKQPGEGKIVFPVLGFVVPAKDRLHLLE
ncbi:MAG TPA: hypothetical protein VMU43_01610 [Candidatus Acidoferrum sp.]|nr:hypothetical protein [Candidatus Acidoferrum sp.]